MDELSVRGVASGIYGLVVCAATLAAASSRDRILRICLDVLVALVVYWAAETYAHALARRAVTRRPLTRAELGAVMTGGWPLVSASFLPLATLVVADLLGAATRTAVNAALLVTTALLLLVGFRAARASGLRGGRLVGATALSGLLGLAMILLKNLAAH